jgi:hypothetical protein
MIPRAVHQFRRQVLSVGDRTHTQLHARSNTEQRWLTGRRMGLTKSRSVKGL